MKGEGIDLWCILHHYILINQASFWTRPQNYPNLTMSKDVTNSSEPKSMERQSWNMSRKRTAAFCYILVESFHVLSTQKAGTLVRECIERELAVITTDATPTDATKRKCWHYTTHHQPHSAQPAPLLNAALYKLTLTCAYTLLSLSISNITQRFENFIILTFIKFRKKM